MAMYVLMAFDNDDHAKKWIEVQQMYAARRRALSDEEAPEGTGNYDVVAMYKKPTLFCNVMDGNHAANRRVIGFTKGKKFEWWVCAQCSKPREMYVQGIREHSSFGRNLINDPTYGIARESTTSE